jgi:hypothetical protein
MTKRFVTGRRGAASRALWLCALVCGAVLLSAGRGDGAASAAPTVKARLLTSGCDAGAAGFFEYRIANEGKRPIQFGLDPKVETDGPDGWSPVHITQNGVPFLFGTARYVIDGPGFSQCVAIPLSDLEPGSYRVNQRIVGLLPDGKRKPVKLSARFTVGGD